MRGNTRRDTSPELALRRNLHARGLRYRVDVSIVAGEVRTRPDIVFRRHAVVIYVDGCFWHSCPTHGRPPKANSAYWTAKLKRNRDRDIRVNEALTAAGWNVIRVWEHDDPALVADHVALVISEARTNASSISRS